MSDGPMAGGKAKMGRPKLIKHGLRLNLYVDREIKQKLFSMATERRVSVSAVVRDLVFAEAALPLKTNPKRAAAGPKQNPSEVNNDNYQNYFSFVSS